MAPKFLVTLSNWAGELDRAEALSEESAAKAAVRLIEGATLLRDGDTIAVSVIPEK